MKSTLKEAAPKSKHGINLLVYKTGRKEAGVVYVEVKQGHFQEFYDKKSTFIYYVIQGKGRFYLNRKAVSVKARDLIVAPPKTKIYYLGKMKMLLTTVPAWRPENEAHVRFIKKPKRNK